jgi:hypothetical protein
MRKLTIKRNKNKTKNFSLGIFCFFEKKEEAYSVMALPQFVCTAQITCCHKHVSISIQK